MGLTLLLGPAGRWSRRGIHDAVCLGSGPSTQTPNIGGAPLLGFWLIWSPRRRRNSQECIRPKLIFKESPCSSKLNDRLPAGLACPTRSGGAEFTILHNPTETRREPGRPAQEDQPRPLGQSKRASKGPCGSQQGSRVSATHSLRKGPPPHTAYRGRLSKVWPPVGVRGRVTKAGSSTVWTRPALSPKEERRRLIGDPSLITKRALVLLGFFFP
jgi:hypothetical protein